MVKNWEGAAGGEQRHTVALGLEEQVGAIQRKVGPQGALLCPTKRVSFG